MCFVCVVVVSVVVVGCCLFGKLSRNNENTTKHMVVVVGFVCVFVVFGCACCRCVFVVGVCVWESLVLNCWGVALFVVLGLFCVVL